MAAMLHCIELVVIALVSVRLSVVLGNDEICIYAKSKEDIFQNIQNTFEQNRDKKQHVTLLFDRSASVSTTQASQQQHYTATNLTKYLIASGLLLVGDEYTTISVITFSSVNLFLVQGSATTCDATDAVETAVQYAEGKQTFLTDALNSVISLYKASPDSNNVLWVFYDGDSDESETKKQRQTEEAVDELRRMGVKTFAVAIGDNGWLTSLTKEGYIKALVTDVSNYYICAKDLLPLLLVENARMDNESVPDVFQACGRYDACMDILEACEDPMENPNCTFIDYPRLPASCSSLEPWFLAVLAVAALLILAAFIFCGVMCYCNIKACCEAPHQRSPKIIGARPELRKGPPPPVPPRAGSDPRMINAVCKSMDDYEDEYDDVTTTVGLPDSAGRRNLKTNSGYEFPRVDIEAGENDFNNSRYQNDVTQETQLKMPGWDTFLTAVLQDYGLRHLGIFQKPRRLQVLYMKAAWTPGFRLPGREVMVIYRCVKDGVHNYQGDLNIAEEKFAITNSAHKSYTELRAIRKDAPQGRRADHLVAVLAGNFVVAGMGLDEDKCYDAVIQVQRQILKSQDNEKDELIYERPYFSKLL